MGRTKFRARNSKSGATNKTARTFCVRSTRRSAALSEVDWRAEGRPARSVAPVLKQRPRFPYLAAQAL